MANNHFLASYYRENKTDAFAMSSTVAHPLLATQGILRSFPSALTQIKQAPNGTVACGVTMNSIIELFPSGLGKQGQSTFFYSDSTVTALDTLAK